MKTRFGFALLLLATLGTGTGKTLPSPAQQSGRASLELDSVTVWLGMAKKDLLKKLSDKSFYVTEPQPDSFIALSESKNHVYSIRFRDGVLIYADREWYTKGSEIEDAILNGLSALSDSSGANAPCAVIHSPLSEPDFSGDRIFIKCGQRNLLIGKFKIQGTVSMSVSESIGELPR